MIDHGYWPYPKPFSLEMAGITDEVRKKAFEEYNGPDFQICPLRTSIGPKGSRCKNCHY